MSARREPLVLTRIPLGFHRKDGVVCEACERGSKAGIDYYERGDFKRFLCYMCVIRFVANLTEMGYDVDIQVAQL